MNLVAFEIVDLHSFTPESNSIKCSVIIPNFHHAIKKKKTIITFKMKL